jgi:hypothetical protein
MIIGSHLIIYSRNAEADRAFLQQVLKFPHVDVGGGWLIFGLPPSEVAFHPHEQPREHEFYLMCSDIGAFVRDMQDYNIACSPVKTERWGLLTQLTLPGGGQLGVYEPRHARPAQVAPKKARRPAKRKRPQTKTAPRGASRKAARR